MDTLGLLMQMYLAFCVWRHWCSPMFPCTGATRIVPLETPSQQLTNCLSGLVALHAPHAGQVRLGASRCAPAANQLYQTEIVLSVLLCGVLLGSRQRHALQPPKTFPHTLPASQRLTERA